MLMDEFFYRHLKSFINLASHQYSLASFEHHIEWVKKFNLYSPAKADYYKQLFITATSVLNNHNEEKSRLFADFCLFILCFDDVVDQSWMILSCQETKKVANFMLSAISGKQQKQALNLDKFHHIALKNILMAWQDICLRLQQVNKNKQDIQPIYRGLKKFLVATKLEFQIRKNKTLPSMREYLRFRAIAGGTDLSCEIAFFLNKVILTENLRKNPHFLTIKNSAYRALIIANDLLSFKKEQAEEPENINLINLIQTHLKFNEEKTVKYCIKLHNYYSLIFHRQKLEINSQIKNTSDNSIINLAIELVANHIQAHLDWGKKTSRYGNSGAK